MVVLKFGGKSLANGTGLENSLNIIKKQREKHDKLVLVVSARSSATDELESMLEKASLKQNYLSDFQNFKEYQSFGLESKIFEDEFSVLENIFNGISLLGEYSLKIKDLVLAQGELISSKYISNLLRKTGIPAAHIDSRNFFVTDEKYGSGNIFEGESEYRTQKFFKDFDFSQIAVVTGFIAADKDSNTTTLGRNGSNYSASLLAKYIKAEHIFSYTNVSGIYTANPLKVADAKVIKHLTFKEANEIASFGASILHNKTIQPLVEDKIPLRILNTFEPESEGTLISEGVSKNQVKSISVEENICLITIEGRRMRGKKGIDAGIFSTMSKNSISIGVISQGSSERSVSFTISKSDQKIAVEALNETFASEISNGDITAIYPVNDVSLITVIGQNVNGFSQSYRALNINNIDILLINNTINGNNISLVVHNSILDKSVNVIHSQVFGVAKNINIAIFGCGTVGGALIEQILSGKQKILERKETNLNIFSVASSKKLLLNSRGISENWKSEMIDIQKDTNIIDEVVGYAKNNHLVNLIAIDNTASKNFVESYIPLINNGFDIISSNKVANTVSYDFYKELRSNLKSKNKDYLYETNVGAGLPLIDTIKLLHDSGENITGIQGVFSGTLSYIFNRFSENEIEFSKVLAEAVAKGFTEPDPREDLCGNDVARKLLILARELDLSNEFDDISIKNLIPENLRKLDVQEFMGRLEDLNSYFENLKNEQKPDHVLRYVGILSGDLQQSKGKLDVDLISVPKSSALGQLTGSDSIFVIYTESYGNNPIVIQGAGAGAQVTARGVFGDLLRIAEKK